MEISRKSSAAISVPISLQLHSAVKVYPLMMLLLEADVPISYALYYLGCSTYGTQNTPPLSHIHSILSPSLWLEGEIYKRLR